MKRTTASAVAAATLLAAGCSSSTPTPAPVTVFVTPTTTATATPTGSNIPRAEKSPRGNLVKTVGAPGAVGRANEPPTVTFTVTKITVDEPCSKPYADKSSRGHFVVVDMNVETSTTYTGDNITGFHPGNDWSLVDADGTTLPHADSDAVYGCHDADWPTTMQSASTYKFRLTFDSPTDTGILVYNPDPSGNGGWEWAF